MKKKKLKKRIKGLENTIVQTTESHRTMIGNLGEKYTELREDFNRLEQNRNTDLGMIKDACLRIDTEIDGIQENLSVLKQRTDIDYTKFSKPIADTSKGPDDVTPNCETCKYKGFDLLFTDSPYYGCTAGNYKMYEPKEEQE